VSDFRTVPGFDEAWRPPVDLRRRTPKAVLTKGTPSQALDVRARLARVAGRAPEVMVKVTGRTRDAAHLRAHLEYISRNGQLEMEDRDGNRVVDRGEVRDLADDWAAAALMDARRRANTPMSLSVVLSMPAGTDAIVLRDAARQFAGEVFGERFDYAFALHTDADHPHVHIAVRALGDDGARLNPKKADLEAWRQAFAQALRDRGIAAEATPRRARGVTLKAERTPVRKLRERREKGVGSASRVYAGAVRDAANAAFLGDMTARPWELATLARQKRVRALYLAQARILMTSPFASDQALGRAVEAFVQGMPAPDSQRLALARQLRAANEQARQRDREPGPGRSR